MLDVGWSELMLIGIVALIVIGPKELPQLFRTLGRLTGRARQMAREFSSAMEDAAREAGVDEAAKSLKDVKSLTSKKSLGLDALDRAVDKFEKWEPSRPLANGNGAQGKGQADAVKPDPAAPVPPAAPARAAEKPADAQTQDAPAQTADGQDAAASQSRRRIHAIRRSDMKDR
ncbi:Sec-independent protein translocase protein TatB [uncultured Paracoccus sp.]|uniref:Sec-independent protein translocase protein TatB n=1 Tax=uncultured Paracoccus sp. TaxID=189685 RepID=UPI0025DEFB54|nr:Sec-independent protein translocase protein TatB [uncultured Paracoccus sp.]